MANRQLADDKKNLGNTEFNVKNFEAAIAYYTEAIQIDSSSHVYFSNRSAAYAAIHDWEKAAQDARECIRLNPKFTKGYHRLSTALEKLGRKEEAIDVLKAAQQIDSDNPELLRLLRQVEGGSTNSSSQSKVLPTAVSKELATLQNQFAAVSREIAQMDAKIKSYTHEKKKLNLTKTDLNSLPKETPLFRSIGKMFMAAQQDETEKSLNEQISKVTDQITALEARKEYLERQKKSLEENVKELISQHTHK